MNTMYDYYLEQPGVLNDIFSNRASAAKAFVESFGRERPDRLYLIASGSSLNAALAAEAFMELALGIEVRCSAPSSLPAIRGERPFILFISQGGSSTNTIAAIKALSAYPMLALTGAEACRINELCAHSLIPCGPELAGPKTKGYTATALTLMMMALEAGRAAGTVCEAAYGDMTAHFASALVRAEEGVASVTEWYRRNESTLSDMENCVVVGKGTGAQAAREAALKIQETLLLSVCGYEFEEFLHGPSMALNATTGGFYLMPPKSDPDYTRMAALALFHRTISPSVYMIGGGDELTDGRDCAVGHGDAWYTRVFTWVLPCQVTGALLSLRKGLEGKGSQLFRELDNALNIKYKPQA